jgi:hypothetical protein
MVIAKLYAYDRDLYGIGLPISCPHCLSGSGFSADAAGIVDPQQNLEVFAIQLFVILLYFII